MAALPQPTAILAAPSRLPERAATRIIQHQTYVPQPAIAVDRNWYQRVEPANMMPQDLRPRTPCEFCALSLVTVRSAFEKESITVGSETLQVHTSRPFPLLTLKPVDSPCQRCGMNEPRGTYPFRWTITARVGESDSSTAGTCRLQYIRYVP